MVDEDPGRLGPLRLWPSVIAVVSGGALGTLVRALVLKLQPTMVASTVDRSWLHAVPWWLFAVNTVGVFVAVVALSGPLRGRSPDDFWRLFVVTGVLGGLTSYSAVVRDAFDFPSREWWFGVVIVTCALALGIAAATVAERTVRSRWR